MPNLINQMIARELTTGFARANGLICVSFSGLTVAETETLRDALAERGVRLRVVRNRLARLALREKGFEAPEDLLEGSLACVWGRAEDTIHAAKVMQQSGLHREGKIAFRGGFLEGELLGPQQAAALATLPGREELRARLLGAIAGPAQKIVTLLKAPQGALTRVIQARIDAQGGDGSPAA